MTGSHSYSAELRSERLRQQSDWSVLTCCMILAAMVFVDIEFLLQFYRVQMWLVSWGLLTSLSLKDHG